MAKLFFIFHGKNYGSMVAGLLCKMSITCRYKGIYICDHISDFDISERTTEDEKGRVLYRASAGT